MGYRKEQEQVEKRLLSQVAMRSIHSKGRVVEEAPCEFRTEFQRDRDRIVHSKAFRRLAQKTQVFILPEGDHYRTRLTHTLEVSQIARTIARALRLNEDLTEAIALGHDLGHTPFGHTGEHSLQELTNGEFVHNKQSLRVVNILENHGQGLNLTFEVRDGILNHPTKGKPSTVEGKVVQLADKIAYINHDIDDAIRGKVLQIADIPKEYVDVLGKTQSERVNTLISNIVMQSKDKNEIVMSQEVKATFYALRAFLFDKVYIGSSAKEQEDKAKQVVYKLYEYYIGHFDKLPPSYIERLKMGDSEKQIVCDYIAGMTDRYAIHQYMDLFFPRSWQVY
ncbi:deoxyguanosinetriphosphate triphosphohydrolase [Cellulosilyticum ruminicola]|uniref:deoxyguanosinetriphosphate triphosphohydrolase n=1 Tax=Cellulosilyticum ruminicola TaxID=425254 RepID=UPI0006CFFECF|nr:deoxyguanosinetriphosphate triphosphohydrolase [Cellulosilyticum ruminicola]